MILADLPAGASLFLDANILVYHFEPHPVLGPACNQLMQSIENDQVRGLTSTHVLSEMAHRLILTIAPAVIAAAAALSQQTGLLTNDALIVAVMREHGLVNLASHDSDFDRVPGLTRYSPA
jgi:predicted nucleic acid-binding protein